MRESAIEFRREKKIWIYGRHPAAPELGVLSFQWAIEARVDLGRVEKPCEIFERMNLSVLHAGGIEDSAPIFIRPSGSADADRVQINLR